MRVPCLDSPSSSCRSSQRPRLRPPILVLAAAGLLVLGLAPHAAAQAVRGTLLGTVTDSSGATIPGATVTITETQTNSTTSTVTNDSGVYTIPNLKDGIYRIEAELQGFRKTVRDGVQVDVNTTVRVDLSLQPGELTETVNVSAETPALQTDRTDTGRIIQGEQISTMPLGFGRNFQAMIQNVPGASRPFRPHSEFFNSQDSLSSNVNGQSRLANNVQIEGVDDNHRSGLLTVLIPSAEALETVSISTSNYDAEFGRAGGAVTSVTLKSGTNQFKGSAFFFGDTDATQAINAFTDRSLPKDRQLPKIKYNQWGATLGGPLVRNKLFFFGDYAYTYDDLGRVNRYVLPSAAFRNGDFSASSVPIYDPLTGDPNTGVGRTPFANNQIPANRISPIAQRILQSIPLPNIPGAALGQVNYQDTTIRQRRNNSFDTKINYQATAQDQLSVRYSFERPTVFEPSTFAGNVGGPFQGGFIGTGKNLTYSAAGNWTRTWTNTLVMDAHGGVSYYHNTAVSAGDGLTTAADLGIPGANIDKFTSGMTSINMANGWSSPLAGYSASLPWNRGETAVTVATTLTKLWGNHTVKFGADYRHNVDYLLQTQDAGGPRGEFQFRAGQTASPSDAASQSALANGFASFLLDMPNRVQRDLEVVNQPGVRNWAIFSFVHDKWQATSKMTLDLGLRYEYYQPFVGMQDKGGLSQYDPTTNTLQVAGYGNVPQNLGVESNFRNVNPRLGITYRPTQKDVFRAGYGVGTAPFADNSYLYNFPVKQTNVLQSANAFVTPVGGSMANGFPAPAVAAIPANGIIDVGSDPRLKNSSYFFVPTNLKEGLLHSWNVAYQRELPGNFTAEVAYVGNHGQDIIARLDLNASLTPGTNDAGRPQFAQFGRTGSTTAFLPYKTKYNSLQVKVDRRFKNNFLITNAYTLGRGYNYNGDDSNASISTPANIALSWGRTVNDRLHTFNSSFVYGLPFKHDGALGWVLNGWQVAGLFTAQSGQALDITMSGALLRAPGNTQRPNLNGTSKIIGGIGSGKLWFDTSVFSAPPENTFGNLTRNGAGIDGPGLVNLDGSLVKRFDIRHTYAEFRVDAFNVTNSLHANNPNTTFGDATFGQITGSYGERLVRFGLRFVF
jgi:Carboxypeptidase regulatory-like domain